MRYNKILSKNKQTKKVNQMKFNKIFSKMITKRQNYLKLNNIYNKKMI